jgi:hypothetical protein
MGKNPTMSNPTTAVRLSPAWDDPEAVRRVVRAAGPFWPLANYAASDAEMAALGGQRNVFTPPWFRQDFALDGNVLVDGAEVMLANERFIAAARAIAGPDTVVRPTTVYVNIMGATPFPFPPHLDVPAFRGFTRATYPVWLLKVMRTSELFEHWRTKLVTAVSWFYEGEGGDFHYWPDGADGRHEIEHPPFVNVGVVADNESTFHGVGPLGAPGSRMPDGLDSDSRLLRGDGGWDVHDQRGATLAHFADAEARITTSWKAEISTPADTEGRARAGKDDLDLESVVTTFAHDLRARGIDTPPPLDPLTDQEWIQVIGATYVDRAPAIN